MEILVIALGIFIGIVAGMLPGIGPSFVMLMLFPILLNFDLISLFVFYFVLVSSSQYYGSVSAITYGVSGEISSLPAVVYGHPLYQQGKGSELLALTSTASLVASLFGISLMVIVQFYTENLIWFFKQNVIITVYSVILFLIVVLTKNKLLSFAMLLSGLVIGKMGFDPLFMTHIILPKYTAWEAGIPFYALFAGFLMFPILIDCFREQRLQKTYQSDFTMLINPIDRLKLLVSSNHWGSVFRGTLIGSLVGLVPGASYFFSSNIAAKIEKQIVDKPEKIVISAEAANNSGSITVLLPLLFFAIPIIASESIVLSLAETKGFGYTVSLSFLEENLYYFVMVLLIANLINWIIAGYFYKYVSDFYWKIKTWIYPVVLIFCFMMLLYVAYNDNNLLVNLVVFFIALPLGLSIKNVESKFVMMFGFFMSSFVIDEFYRFFIINFT